MTKKSKIFLLLDIIIILVSLFEIFTSKNYFSKDNFMFFLFIVGAFILLFLRLKHKK